MRISYSRNYTTTPSRRPYPPAVSLKTYKNTRFFISFRGVSGGSRCTARPAVLKFSAFSHSRSYITTPSRRPHTPAVSSKTYKNVCFFVSFGGGAGGSRCTARAAVLKFSAFSRSRSYITTPSRRPHTSAVSLRTYKNARFFISFREAAGG